MTCSSRPDLNEISDELYLIMERVGLVDDEVDHRHLDTIHGLLTRCRHLIEIVIAELEPES